MPYILGIDTGGTYTDGVIIETDTMRIVGKSKFPTKRQDLISSIFGCLNSLDIHSPKEVKLVCLSTTLATNAVVEGVGAKTALILIGKAPKGRIPSDHIEVIKGGYDIKGRAAYELDFGEVEDTLDNIAALDVEAIGISGYLSVRNPEQEKRIKQMVREKLGLPVVCAHELSGKLGYYDRTVTAALNARLISLVNELISAAKSVLRRAGITAPLMIVKGDGSLMQESYATSRPVETILSGPAASITGGVFLTGKKDACIVDMGGTTTDIAFIEKGNVKILEDGAAVGGWRTHVCAADINTHGLGGDSYIRYSTNSELIIGPQRAVPLCSAGVKYPYLLDELVCQFSGDNYMGGPEGLILLKKPRGQICDNKQLKIIKEIETMPHSCYHISKRIGLRPEDSDIDEMQRKGMVQRIGFTPTDILHAMSRINIYSKDCASAGAAILAKFGSFSVDEFLNSAYDRLTAMLVRFLLETAESHGDMEKDIGIGESFLKPIIAVGAPAIAWIPPACKILGTEFIVPDHAEVANAVGAATGSVTEMAKALIRKSDKEEEYILHMPNERRKFRTLEETMKYAMPAMKEYISIKMKQAGSGDYVINIEYEDVYCETSSGREFVETRLNAIGSGKPDWAMSQG